MRTLVVCLLVTGIALAGCTKKEAASPMGSKAKKYLLEGTSYLKAGDVAQAIKSFVTAVKVDPNYFESYFMLGETLIRLKQFPQAVAVLSSAIRQFPNNGLAYYLLAMAHEGAQQPVAAIVAARRSVELFNAAGDQEGSQRAMVLLAAFVSAAKQEAERQMTENAAREAANAVANTAVAPAPLVE